MQGIDGSQQHVKLFLRHIADFVETGVRVYHKSWACDVKLSVYVDIVAEDLAQMQKIRR
jgi:hypothetical protein